MEVVTEHVFVIRVEKVSGLMPLQSTVWGETDCYVQYRFPCQEGDVASNVDQSLIESSKAIHTKPSAQPILFVPKHFKIFICPPTALNLKPFRSTTTLCVPDLLFGHTETHVLLAPEGVPVQRLLLSSLSAQGLSNGGGILFEVWCRFVVYTLRSRQV